MTNQTPRKATQLVGVMLLGVMLLSSVRIVRADTPEPIADVTTSHEHFNRGVEYVHDGDLKGALIEFKRAYAVSPNYRVLYNLGQVANALGRYTDAQQYYQRYLSDGEQEIASDRRRDVEAQLSKLKGRIATLVLASNVEGAEIFVDNISVGTSPLSAPIQVSSGTRTIAAAVSGRPRVTQVVEVAGGDTVAVELDFPKAPEPPHPAPLPAPVPQPQHTPEPEHGSNAALWLGLTSGVLAAGAGVMGYLTVRDARAYDNAVARKTTVRELDDLDSRASTKALVTDLLLGATAISAAVTLFVALKGHGDRESAPAPSQGPGAQLSLGPGAISLHGAF